MTEDSLRYPCAEALPSLFPDPDKISLLFPYTIACRIHLFLRLQTVGDNGEICQSSSCAMPGKNLENLEKDA
jgi:hypothetical protein